MSASEDRPAPVLAFFSPAQPNDRPERRLLQTLNRVILTRPTHSGSTRGLLLAKAARTDSFQKYKLFASIGLIVLCLVWLGYYLTSAGAFRGRAQALDTPAWRIAREINDKLTADPRFHDAGFSVESETPMKFKVNGAVQTRADLAGLEEFLKQIRPEGDFELNVEVLRN